MKIWNDVFAKLNLKSLRRERESTSLGIHEM